MHEYWSGRPDLNPRPPVPQTGALPDCATPRQASKSSTRPPRTPLPGRAGRSRREPGASRRRARPSTRGRAGRRGSAGRSCPRTARAGPRGRSASRRRAGRPARAPPGPCRRPRRCPAGRPRSRPRSGPWPAPRRGGGCATARDPHVAMRSPIPASPANVSGFAPAAIPSRIISARPRVSRPGLAVVAEAEPVGGAGRDRDDVLERPGQLDAEDVLVDVQPEPPAGQPGDDPPRELEVRARPRRPTPAGCARPRRPGSGRTARRSDRPAMPAASAMTSLIRSSVPRSRPLTTDRMSATGARYGAQPLDGRPQVRRRRREDHQVRGRGEGRRVRGRDDGPSAGPRPGSRASLRPVVADPCRRLRGVAQQRDRLAPGPRAGPAWSPTPRPRRPRRAGRPSAGPAGLRLAAGAPRRLRAAPAADRAFLRRGSLTEARSRKTSRIGVPSKPNVSRSRFSR